MSNKADLAWAAGLIDGEGCITIIHVPAGRQKGCKTDRFTLVLKVTMGHKQTVDRLAKIFANGTVQNHQARREGVNASFSYVAQSRKAAAALALVRPHLFTKAREADLAIAFMKLPLALAGGAHGNTITPKSLLRRRLSIYWKVRKLKSRWRFYTDGKRYKTRGGMPL